MKTNTTSRKNLSGLGLAALGLFLLLSLAACRAGDCDCPKFRLSECEAPADTQKTNRQAPVERLVEDPHRLTI